MHKTIERTVLKLSALGLLILLAAYAVPGIAAVPCGDWGITPTPNTRSTSNYLFDVAAIGPKQAMALGRDDLGTFAMDWNGTSWSVTGLPSAKDVGYSYQLNGIGSTPKGFLWAVGAASSGGRKTMPVVMRRDGTRWDVIETIPVGSSQRAGEAMDVHAVADDDVWVVGSAAGLPLTMHWDGFTWSEVGAPAPGDRQNSLYAVAAASANNVWAVGEFRNVREIPAVPHALILKWSGSSWAHIPNPLRSLGNTRLHDVAVLGPADVWVAGSHKKNAVFMHWDGLGWTLFPGPVSQSTIPGEIVALAALATDDIWASSGSEYFHWDGSEWSAVAPPPVTGAAGVRHGVAMEVVGGCDVWSVGSYNAGAGGRTLAERLTQDPRPTAPVPVPRLAAAVPGTGGVAAVVRLHPSAPNPFNPRTTIRFELERAGRVMLEVFDIRGRNVATLVDGERGAGEHAVPFVADGLPSGTYFARLKAEGTTRTTRMQLVR